MTDGKFSCGSQELRKSEKEKSIFYDLRDEPHRETFASQDKMRRASNNELRLCPQPPSRRSNGEELCL